jgi:hypothetical protein
VLDVAANKVLVSLVAQEESAIVRYTTEHDEEAHEHGAGTRSVALVEVARAPVLRKAILQKVVVSLTTFAAQNLANDSKSARTLLDLFVV